jgi:hypothetical protein
MHVRAEQGCRTNPLTKSSENHYMCQLPKQAICSPTQQPHEAVTWPLWPYKFKVHRNGHGRQPWYNQENRAKQLWVASTVPLKVLKMIWMILYHSKNGMNPGHFIIHTDKGDIVLKNNSHGMPFLNLKEEEAEVAQCLIQDTFETVQNNMEGFYQA